MPFTSQHPSITGRLCAAGFAVPEGRFGHEPAMASDRSQVTHSSGFRAPDTCHSRTSSDGPDLPQHPTQNSWS
jgi:hypothetical protein